MPTPLTAFSEIASRFGVDPSDKSAIEHFFDRTAPELPPDEQAMIIAELLERDGEAEGSDEILGVDSGRSPKGESSPSVLLTNHQDELFLNQTVYLSGQAFTRCKFVACTLILRESVYHLDQCTFERCNWHVNWVLLWGDPKSTLEVKALIRLMETAAQSLTPALPDAGVPENDAYARA